MKRIILAVLLIGLILPCTFAAKSNNTDSREFKILLHTENFASLNKGCKMFWDLVDKVAKDNKIKSKFGEKKLQNREICFMDTAKFDLYKKGFILRVRGEEISPDKNTGLIAGKTDSELTLKFRATDKESTLVAPVNPSEDFSNDLSTEEDVVVKVGTPHSMFSKSGKVFGFEQAPSNIAEISKFFPLFTVVGLNPKSGIVPVNSLIVTEKRIQSGALYFGEKKTKTLFSFWYKKGEEKPFAAEFSFKIKLAGKKFRQTVKNPNDIETFFVDLVKRGEKFINSTQTKTGMVYQAK